MFKKMTDISGNIYNDLTVISFHSLSERGKSKWNCICKCGTKVIVKRNNLVSNATKSCGCRKYCKLPNVGTIFNRLIVIKNLGFKNKYNYTLCECICKKQIEVKTCNLLNNKIAGCGCIKGKNKIGETFNRLTIIGHEKINNKYYWVCQCFCGKITRNIYSNLKKGIVKSCGCHKTDLCIARCGEKHYLYNPNLDRSHRDNDLEETKWRTKVFTRDDYIYF